MPLSRPGPSTRRPRIRTSPVLGVSSPPTMRMTVVLPQPEGPTKTTNSPAAMSRVRGSTTGIAGPWPCANDLVRARNPIWLPRGDGTGATLSKVTEPAPVQEADRLVGDEADHADGQDPGEHLGRLAVAARGPRNATQTRAMLMPMSAR